MTGEYVYLLTIYHEQYCADLTYRVKLTYLPDDKQIMRYVEVVRDNYPDTGVYLATVEKTIEVKTLTITAP